MIKSIQFPKMFNRTVTNTVEDYDATLQNLTMLINSEKRGLFGDPYFGTNVKKYMFDQNDAVLADILIDDIYTAVATFMPQLIIERKNIAIINEGTKIIINIQAKNREDFQTNLYNIVLLDTNV